MSAEAYGNEEMYRTEEPEAINIKRNPYLVDYEQQRRARERRKQGYERQEGRNRRTGLQEERISEERNRRVRPQEERIPERQNRRLRPQEEKIPERQGRRLRPQEERIPEEQNQTVRVHIDRMAKERKQAAGMRELEEQPRHRRPSQNEAVRPNREDLRSNSNALPQRRRAALERKRAAARRKRIVRIQRSMLCTGVFCIALLCGILIMKRMDAKATEEDNTQQRAITSDILPAASSNMVQGLSSEDYAKHPDWEENFLTPNEYSRPGDALEEVDSIFVHYTANPNTSAAQNRSYFEQLKDTHITSASAHFIIGYDGEIIQCIPLDEIAYAVQTRNFDSVSIECCYKAANGQFTQETYDSLIELLAWLTDTYDLTTDDILRHYDCGGKKCPLYYTEHEDAWEQLKRDVAEKL